jgi:hypothetical protein
MSKIVIHREPETTLEFDLTPEAGEWSGSEDLHRSTGGYTLRINRSVQRGSHRIPFSLTRDDGRTFTVRSYTIEALFPIVDIYPHSPKFCGFVHHQQHGSRFYTSALSLHLPLVTYGNRTGMNRITMGVQDILPETWVARDGRGGYMYYDTHYIRFNRLVDGIELRTANLKDGVFINCDHDRNWFEVQRDYWDWVDECRGYVAKPTPPSAWGPEWCSWFYLDDINEEKIWENAVLGSKLGIKTIGIDAGWFWGPNSRSFTQAPVSERTVRFGEVRPDPDKFPDLKGLVSRIHEKLGMYVWLWVAPIWLFSPDETATDPRLLNARIVSHDGQTQSMLCLRHPATHEHGRRLIAGLLEEFNVDGFKFDCVTNHYLDRPELGVCHADHEHAHDSEGEAMLEWGRGIYAAAKAVKPVVTIQLGDRYLKPCSDYSSNWNEVYCTPDEIWRQNTISKTHSRGVKVQCSEGSWNPAELDVNVACQLAVMLMGTVPELQLDLTRLNDNHRRLVAAWFGFYNEHREALHGGEFMPVGFGGTLGGPMSMNPMDVKIETGEQAYLWKGPIRLERLRLDKPASSLYVFNLQESGGIDISLEGVAPGEYRVQVQDIFLANIREETRAATDGVLRLTGDVPPGGALHAKRIA